MTEHPIFAASFLAQLFVHILVLLSLLFEGLRVFLPIRIIRAFHTMMYFTVLGAWTFIRGRQLSSWK